MSHLDTDGSDTDYLSVIETDSVKEIIWRIEAVVNGN